ncbi:MAG TPA: CBS domain-containing protein [Firmicutes bacterium]|nr:CBS domain-containing protein [Bacillota bacterium]
MRIKEIMTDKVAYVSPEMSLVEVAQLMQKHNIGAMPVVDGDNVVGMVTDRDIVVRNVAHEKDPATTQVSAIMSSQVESVTPEMELNKAAEIMSSKQVRRLPVIEGNKLVGIVSLGDLATQAKYDVELSRTLAEISTPSRPVKM